jgi:hypothetical protein
MRNYIKLWLCEEHVNYYVQGQLFSEVVEWQIGATAGECIANVDVDRQLQLRQNQFQQQGNYYTFTAGDPVPKYFEMNKENVLSMLDPFRVSVDSLFVDESPRDTWSHGE